MDYSCANCLVILVSAVLVFYRARADRQTDRITEADDRYTHVKSIAKSKKIGELVVKV